MSSYQSENGNGQSSLTTSFNSVKVLESPSDFIKWDRDIRDILGISGYASLFTRAVNRPPEAYGAKLETWLDKQERAIHIVQSRCGINARAEIKDCTTVVEALKLLKQRFQPKGSAIFQQLDANFSTLTLAQCNNVSEFAERLRKARSEIQQLHTTCTISEPHFVNRFLSGLGPSYTSFLTTFYQVYSLIPETRSDGTIQKAAVTFDEAVIAAEKEEQAHRLAENTPSMALAAINNNKGQGNQKPRKQCSHCNQKGHEQDGCWHLYPEKRKAYQEKRRKEREILKLHRQQEGQTSQSTTPGSSSVSAIAYQPPTSTGIVHLVSASLSTTAASTSTILAQNWLLDTGCNQHTSGDQRAFIPGSLKPYTGSPVTGFGGATSQATHVGTVRIPCNVDGKLVELLLSDTLFHPGSGCNLISPAQLSRKGIQPQFSGTGIRLPTAAGLISADERFGLYLIRLWQPIAALPAYAIQDDWLRAWHARFGHPGEQTLKDTASLVTGMRPLPHSSMCISCVRARQKETPHNHPSRRGEYPLEFLHTDLSGRLFQGHGGAQYYCAIIDDLTGFTWVKALRTKDEFPLALRNFLEQHERPERRCHRIRLDQAGENTSNQMQELCADRGIYLETTATNQHQQNGMAEVTIRIITERCHATLDAENLPKTLWPFIAESIAYLRNLTRHSRTGLTPHESWWGTKPDVSHLRPLGCRAIALKTTPRKKLADDKGEECRLLGYHGAHIYRLLRHDGVVILSSNVIFREKRPCLDLAENPSIEPAPTTEVKKKVRLVADPTTANQAQRATATDPPTTTILPEPSVLDNHSTIDQEPATPTAQPEQREEHDLDSTDDEAPVSPGHQEIRQLTRINRGTFDPSKPQYYGRLDPRFAVVTCLLGATFSALEALEPTTVRQAKADSHWQDWLEAMKMELKSLHDNKTWTLVPKPSTRKVLGGKWVYKLKKGPKGEILRHKARWVVRGFEQREGIDYNETFASVVKPMSYKALFAIAAAQDLEIHQMDVKTAFLYGDIDEEIFVEQPTELGDGSDRVCRLNKALYGLKQSPRIWYNTLSNFLDTLGFKALDSDTGVFTKDGTFIAIYVDDLLIAGPNLDDIEKLKQSLSNRFQMSDMGECSFYLGMEIIRDRKKRVIRLSQRAYLHKILADFDMLDSKPFDTPMDSKGLEPTPKGHQADPEEIHWYQRAIGSLMYLMLGTRPDIAFSVSYLSRHMANPIPSHKSAVKRVFRYLKGSQNLELVFLGELQPLQGYTDSSYADDKNTRRSTSGYLFHMGSGAISWSSKRQSTVALSSCEAEYIAETQAAKEAIWLRRLLQEMLLQENPSPTTIFADNQGAIALAKNPQFHARTKHIDTNVHFVREKQAEGVITLEYIPTEQQLADGLTKPLPREPFQRFRSSLGLARF